MRVLAVPGDFLIFGRDVQAAHGAMKGPVFLLFDGLFLPFGGMERGRLSDFAEELRKRGNTSTLLIEWIMCGPFRAIKNQF